MAHITAGESLVAIRAVQQDTAAAALARTTPEESLD